MSVEEGRALGGWLGVVSRAVVGVVEEGGEGDGEGGRGFVGGDWNVVQNNGKAFSHFVLPFLSFAPSSYQ